MENIYNKTMAFFNITDNSDLLFTLALQGWVILPIALPMVCVAIYGLFSQIKTDHVAPVYVINLLISDMLQICAKPILFTLAPAGITYELMNVIYSTGVLSSTVFMVCIAGERYALIAHPLRYRFHRTITKSLLCSLTVWVATLVVVGSTVVTSITGVIDIETLFVGSSVFCLLPYPFVIFFFVGSWRALSKSVSVSPHEQRRIMGTLALVLFIYTVLFLPHTVIILVMKTSPWLIKDTIFQYLPVISSIFLSMNPLVDPVLYVFATKKKSILTCCSCRCCGPQGQPQHREFCPPLSTTMSTREAHI